MSSQYGYGDGRFMFEGGILLCHGRRHARDNRGRTPKSLLYSVQWEAPFLLYLREEYPEE